jgi:hypothetical protein
MLRLRSALREFFPAALEAFPDLSAPDALELLVAAPDPAAAATLSRTRIARAAGGHRGSQVQRGAKRPSHSDAEGALHLRGTAPHTARHPSRPPRNTRACLTSEPMGCLPRFVPLSATAPPPPLVLGHESCTRRTK